MLKAVSGDRVRPFLFAGLILMQCACSGVSFRMPALASDDKAAPPPAAAKTALPAAAKEDAAIQQALSKVQSGGGYKISPADLLEVSVYQEKDLDRKVRVGPDGLITLPLMGSVRVGGMSVPEAEQAILAALRKYLVNPQVSVFIKEYGNKLIYVLGEVQKPGSYTLPTEATLSVLEAITLAGGFTQYAAPDRTRVIRKAGAGSQNITIPISAITKGGDKTKDIALEPNDVIYIPESLF